MNYKFNTFLVSIRLDSCGIACVYQFMIIIVHPLIKFQFKQRIFDLPIKRVSLVKKNKLASFETSRENILHIFPN